jgi:predicted phage tail protein
MAAVNQILAAA